MNYNADCVRCLLQHLSMPCHLTHVEFIFTLNRMEKLKVNHIGITLHDNPAISLSCLLDVFCHLLQQACVVKAQSYTKLEDIHTNINASSVTYVVQKHEDFENISQVPDKLKKLCMLTIRQHLPIKSDENFAKLGLPSGLLSLVTLASLAKELDRMWQEGQVY